ncbi:hypothetical protein AB6A40_002365 [Gnathostoma spinigerum]|uniref:Uncharacterized protein n=1 Tax=Gnathostoma spinigerum TaxID=75299 RepID=A0ABD6EE43_9BILA
MRVLKHGAFVCAPVLLSTHLNCPSSSVIMAESPDGQPYFVVGKKNGEIVFFAIDRDVFRYTVCSDSEVTAIAVGDLRRLGRSQIVAIAADGLLHMIDFPRVMGKVVQPPMLRFEQIMKANICAAKILDIDSDGNSEMVVVMTDRVVRTYRFIEQCLIPLNKWEVPSQICGFAIGQTCCGRVHALLSQSNQKYIIRIDFSQKNGVTIPQSMTSDGRESQLVIPVSPLYLSVLESMTRKIVVVTSEPSTETELKQSPDTIIVAVSTVTLKSGMRLVIGVDMCGLLLVYGWTDELLTHTEPLARVQVLNEAVHMCAMPTNDQYRFLVGITTIYYKIALYQVDLSSVVLLKSV